MMLASLALGACAAPSSYMGVSFAPGAAASDLQDLARRAQAGDKQAQLDLGIAFEEGRGMHSDKKRAYQLYRMAAMTSGGMIYVYQPAVKKGGRGGVVSVNFGPIISGLEAAKVRLVGLKVAAAVKEGN
jgi:TPR repeat protein